MGLYNGKDAVVVLVTRSPGANIIQTVGLIKKRLPAMAAALPAVSAQAQNYPWCAYWHGTGGARNCGFVSFAQCQLTAQGAGADCRANTQYEPNKPMR